MPYLSKLEGGQLNPGQTIFLKGKATGSTRFDINLHAGDRVTGADRSDIPLHVSCHPGEGKMILNTLKSNNWEKEQKEKFPVKQGENFDIRITAHEEKFTIFVNTKRICLFEYRQPVTTITHIYIMGECELTQCKWEGRYYPVPYEASLPDGVLRPGKKLNISGIVEKKSDHFAINLKAGADVALHFNPRFGGLIEKAIVVRNSYRGGVWDDVEERHGEMPFEKDHAFTVTFQTEADQFKIFVNDKEFAQFKHRVPPEGINKISIEGDVDLQSINWF